MTQNETPQGAEQILQAARTVLARDGYAGATIAKIAAEAAVSRGLLHYHFKSKEEMLAIVLRANMDACIDIAQDIILGADSPEALADAVTQTIRALCETDQTTFILLTEGLAQARHIPRVREELEQSYTRYYDAMKSAVMRLKQAGVLRSPMDDGWAVRMIAAMIDGLGLQLTTFKELRRDPAIWDEFRSALLLFFGEDPAAYPCNHSDERTPS